MIIIKKNKLKGAVYDTAPKKRCFSQKEYLFRTLKTNLKNINDVRSKDLLFNVIYSNMHGTLYHNEYCDYMFLPLINKIQEYNSYFEMEEITEMLIQMDEIIKRVYIV